MPWSATDTIDYPCILTHRGLEPGNNLFHYAESSREAFREHLSRGYGIEFDVVFTRDLQPLIWHDQSLVRISEGMEKRRFDELKSSDVQTTAPQLLQLGELLSIVREGGFSSLKALHLKGQQQEVKKLEVLADVLQEFQDLHEQILVFDLKIDAAAHLRRDLPCIHLAPSVAHPFDIARFNACVSGTLYELSAVLHLRHVFDWLVLDEWDRVDAHGDSKILYSEKVVKEAKQEGFSVALISPELHASSPALAGGELHQDGTSIELLTPRASALVSMGVDAICTDYPELYRELIQGKSCSHLNY